jgi:hypothetical protein
VSLLHLVAKLSPFYYSARSCYDPYARGARWLGAGAPITILQFAPLAWLHLVLGFHAIYCVCARFISTRVHFGEPEPASLKEENGRRPIFLIFWPIEVP